MIKLTVIVTTVLLAVLLLSRPSFAGEGSLIPMEDFFRNPEKSGFRISPDSKGPAAQLRMMKKFNTGITVIHI